MLKNWRYPQKLAMLEDCFGEEEEQQQQPASAEVAITNNGQRNQPKWPKKGAQCAKCDVGLCIVPCIMEYHTKVNL